MRQNAGHQHYHRLFSNTLVHRGKMPPLVAAHGFRSNTVNVLEWLTVIAGDNPAMNARAVNRYLNTDTGKSRLNF